MKQCLVITIATVYSVLALMFTMLAPDTYLNNYVHDTCYQHNVIRSFEDGSCWHNRGV